MKKTLASLANRAAVIALVGAMLTMTTAVAHARDKGKSGKLNLVDTQSIGGLTLTPGEYEVKVKDSASGTELEFARWITNPYAQEGLPVYDRELVGTVKAIEQTASNASTRTGFVLAGGNSGKPVGMQIRGNSVRYLFESPEMARTGAQTSGQ